MAPVVTHASRGDSPAPYDRAREHGATPSRGRGRAGKASAVAGGTATRAIGRAAEATTR